MCPALEVFTIFNVNHEGKHLTRLPLRKIKSLTCLLLILASTLIVFSFLPKANATTQISITPIEGLIGTNITITANITNTNGTYQIKWDDNVWTSGNATGNSINANFTVPPTTAGNHNMTIVDVDKNETDTATFKVTTAYSLKTLPKLTSPVQRQEGDSLNITLNMTGGEQGKTNVANVTVKAPNNASYTSFQNITTENDGNGTLTASYPEDFSTGANTNFTGDYGIFLNGTLATQTFFVGLTNASEYHRNQTLNIKAVYEPSENVTLTITGTDFSYSENLTAAGDGKLLYANSTILSNASMIIYTINLTSTSGITRKDPPDIQSFTVPGFAVNVTTRNLAEEPVQGVAVQVFENLRSIDNVTSDSQGLATFRLEFGSYQCNASLYGQEVGVFQIGVNDTGAFNFDCNLTNLRVVVLDEDGIRIPDVELSLTPENQTFTTEINSTDINGTSVVHSLLPSVNSIPINYTLNATRYNTRFNTTTNLYLPTTAWYDLMMVCPKRSLQVNVTDGSWQPIKDANVNLTEVKGGLRYSNMTGTDGLAVLSCTLGKYLVEIFVNGVKLNETTADVNDTVVNVTMNCGFYGLNVSIRVVDYFGQAIPNANVTLQRTGLRYSDTAGGDGLVAFTRIIGGVAQVYVRLSGQSDPCVVTTVLISNSTTIEIKIEKYVVLAGLLVETGQILTIIVIVLAVVFILALEIVMRRKRAKTPKSDS
jgi:hypothetical protein